ncbi:glycine--tRNA ligase subunit beta [Caldichromatium japonicum]|uniref:Glycine--tRNA ligase beta subunit n=1 Tax=Caldichromatium japonicum TaxID=2699430 RepID=A0A6G7VGL6_9GAMM|nr:glycine--tRNA ligase subunit beta [Caldichromatium japonicum]QIK38988.1 glycine--tRNA ligase subunit beta [Caldichromatium japonicum]
MATADLLVEIGTEELPPRALLGLSNAFADALSAQLAEQGLSFAEIEPFAAPRRLALLVRQLATRQPNQESVRRGPAVKAAFDTEGRPTQALLGFARSCGVEIEALAREETPKGAWFVYRQYVPGRPTAELIPALVETALAELPIPKRMRWGDGDASFVRPVHWVCLMLGPEPIPGQVLGIAAEPKTYGHRFHHPEPISLNEAAEYPERLRREGSVEPSFAKRRAWIREQVEALAVGERLRARIDPELLDEVTALVEWPQAILCRFDERFLELPPEVLIATMQHHQRYFPLEDPQGCLQARFIAIANLQSRNPDQIRQGNERVIRPRFADAAFFWAQDLKQPLASFAPCLESAVFQDRLGTQAERCRRLARLGRRLAPAVGVDPALAERSALLSKCDLVSAMVYEFPELQGIMGRYYAERSGEDPCVSAAIEEHYRPRFAGDALPKGPCGLALALADRLDTLVGIFGIGLRPTGTKDPYGLRRAAIAVLRILIETPLDLDLWALIDGAAEGFPPGLLAEDTRTAVLEYLLERLRGLYAERGVAADTVDAVLAVGATNPWDLDRRVLAVTQFRRLPAADALSQANKRIRNILAKADPQDSDKAEPDLDLFVETAEQRLAERVQSLKSQIAPLVAARDYVAVLETLAELHEDVDAFFDEVLVMAESLELRRNRLRLLKGLADLFLEVADISRLQ